MMSVVTVVAGHSVYAGYDFEPPSPRSIARFFGIGPGPGYHSVPCTSHEWQHFYCVTGGFSGMPSEPDYRPNTFSSLSPWVPGSRSISDPTWMAPVRTEPDSQTPTPAPSKRETPSPRRELPARPDSGPTETLPPSTTDRTPDRDQTDSQQRSFGTLLDELLKEQEEDSEEMGELLEELQPPSPSDQRTPDEAAPDDTSSARKDWWW